MGALTLVAFLTFAIFASSVSQSVQDAAPTDTDLALALFECARQAIITGMPEIGLPSHNPLKIKENFEYSLNLGPTSLAVSLDNMVLDGIPWWNVTEAYQMRSDDPNVDIFKYTVYWKNLILTGDWKYTITDSASSAVVDEKSGTINVELDHVNFEGVLDFVKPENERLADISELILNVSAQDAQVSVTNLGLIGELVHIGGGPIVSYLVNHNPIADDLAELVRERLVYGWFQDTARLETLIDHCRH